MAINSDLKATLAKVGKYLPGIGLRNITAEGFYKSAAGKSLLGATYAALIQVKHAELGVQGLIDSDLSGQISPGSSLVQYNSPIPVLSTAWDSQNSDYVGSPVSEWNFSVYMDKEIYVKPKISTSDMVRMGKNPSAKAAIIQSATTAANTQMDLRIVTTQVLGLFTQGADTIKEVSVSKIYAPAEADTLKFRAFLQKEINSFRVQLKDLRKLGLNREDIRLVVSPPVMQFLLECFQKFPTMFAQTLLQTGKVNSILGIELSECLFLGQKIEKNILAQDEEFDFSGFDFCLVIRGGFFKSPVWNFKPLSYWNEAAARGNLYEGYLRSSFLNSKGGKWVFTNEDNTKTWFKCVQRYKIKLPAGQDLI